MKSTAFFVGLLLATFAFADPPAFEDQLVAQRARLGWALIQGGTVLNLAVGPDAFLPWSKVSPFSLNASAPASVRVVNIVVDTGLSPIPRPANTPMTIGSVVSKEIGLNTPAIGTVVVTNPAVLRAINTSVKTRGGL